MSRFIIQWMPSEQAWLVVDSQDKARVVADFPTLLEAETYVIERSERSER